MPTIITAMTIPPTSAVFKSIPDCSCDITLSSAIDLFLLPFSSYFLLPFAFSPSWPVVEACNSRPDRPCARIDRSRDQRLVGESLADRLVTERCDTVQRVNLAIALAAQAERELIDVALHVLDGEVVIDAVVAALEDSPHALNAVCMRHAIHVLLGTVVDRAAIVTLDARIGQRCVGAEHGITFDMRDHFILNCVCIGAGDDDCLYVAAALAHAEDRGLTGSTSPAMELFAFVFVLFLAAQVRLIRFDDARQQAAALRIIAARLTNALKHEPRGLLRDAEFLGNLHGRNALARGRNQVHRVQPLIQGDVPP